MPGKVFISCGQNTEDRRATAKKVAKWLVAQGFSAYVATEVQNMVALNTEILKELRTSDFFLLIDFASEPRSGRSRGLGESRFAHQELAIAVAFGFEKILCLSEAETTEEGILRYMISNVPKFSDRSKIIKILADGLKKACWKSSYTRQLSAPGSRWSDTDFPHGFKYGDHAGVIERCKMLYVDIANQRPDTAAFFTAARLAAIEASPDNVEVSPIRAPLKVTGKASSFEQTIFPLSQGAFDVLMLDLDHPGKAYLNSALDRSPRPPILSQPGRYVLHYECVALGFPMLQFRIELQLAEDPEKSTASLVP